jgi:site-specific recombinase XerD
MQVRDLRTVDEALIERYRGRLFMARLSESTRQLRGQSVPRGFFRWLVRRGHVPVDPMKDLPNSIPRLALGCLNLRPLGTCGFTGAAL